MVAADRTYLNEQAGRYLVTAVDSYRAAGRARARAETHLADFATHTQDCELALLAYRQFLVDIDEAAAAVNLEFDLDERAALVKLAKGSSTFYARHQEHPDDQPAPNRPARFELRRTEDETGVSGTGTVAWGVLFPDGTAVTRWCGTQTDVRQTCVWASLDHVQKIHGHAGKTLLVFHDPAPTIETPTPDDEEPF